MTTVKVLFPFFVGLWENHFGLAIFFLSIYPSSYSILILYGFFLNKPFWFWILKNKMRLDRREKKNSDLTFWRKKIILIIPPLPEGGILFYLCMSVCPSVLPRYFSQQLDSRNLIFGHKFHTGTPYRGKRFWTCLIPTSCLPT